MGWVAGGSKANLVTAYSAGDDSEVTYGKNRYLAQTFTLYAETVLWRFPVKTWTIQGDETYHCALYHTDDYGYPTAELISETTSSPLGEAFYAPGKWWRFDLIGFPKLPAGRYAIVLSVPTAADWTRYRWRCDETDPTFTKGRAFLSHDAGSTWELLPGKDFMFMIYGWEPPPELAPAPVIGNWAVLGIVQEQLIDGYKFTVTTDTKCHLWMRWTNVAPQIHKEAVMRRGMMWHSDLKFCFVAYHENEQEEPEDTLVHTFYKHNWPVCETRWFYFIGARCAETQPSTSPIFEKHFTGTGWGLLLEEPWTRTIVGPPEYDMLFLEPWG